MKSFNRKARKVKIRKVCKEKHENLCTLGFCPECYRDGICG
jgi:hypothetical protein